MTIKNRGFGTMKRKDPERQKALAAKGGEARAKKGTGHQFTSDEARAAGKKSWNNRRRS